jgi:hypothetical protein
MHRFTEFWSGPFGCAARARRRIGHGPGTHGVLLVASGPLVLGRGVPLTGAVPVVEPVGTPVPVAVGVGVAVVEVALGLGVRVCLVCVAVGVGLGVVVWAGITTTRGGGGGRTSR